VIQEVLTRGADAGLRLLFSPECGACTSPLTSPLSGPICRACWNSIALMTPPLCEICGDAVATSARRWCPRCQLELPVFAAARSAGRYDAALREIVHAFKYDRCRALAPALAAMMRDAGGELLLDADAVVPVPLHPWRRWQRGFNQADDLARYLGRPVRRVLRRRRNGPPQASLPAAGRDQNVRGAFGLMPGARSRVRGRVLVVVDDVMTTGATLSACSRVLLEAGARQVYALTSARAVAARTAPPIPLPDPSTARRR
jgi:ComF family protein